MDLYAPEKARISRWLLGVSAILLIGYGTYSLYYFLPSSARAPMFGWRPLGDAFPISIAFVSSFAVLVAGAAGMWWTINYARLVDFLRDVEGEMHKVAWPSKQELISSSLVIVVATGILASWVALVDLILLGVRQVIG